MAQRYRKGMKPDGDHASLTSFPLPLSRSKQPPMTTQSGVVINQHWEILKKNALCGHFSNTFPMITEIPRDVDRCSVGKITDRVILTSPQNKAGSPAYPTPSPELHKACLYVQGVQHFPNLFDPKTQQYPVLFLCELDVLYTMIFLKWPCK